MRNRIPMRFAALALSMAVAAHAETPFSPLSGADIVILGEVHDNPDHHDLQLIALDGLDPAAIVFEMLTKDEAMLVAGPLARDVAALEQALDWGSSGWPDFDYYAPLMAYGASIPVYGAEVPRETAQRAFGEGAAAVFGDGATRYGLDTHLPSDEQAAREEEQFAAHCEAVPREILPGFVEAQRLRDAELARTALTALEETGGPVVVIAGNGHARRDQGIPALVAVAAPEVRVASLGLLEEDPRGPAPYDVVMITAPAEREDPCAAFR
ncbi:hypothetical protein HKCCE2091_10070 [Rhodobacterales bacterium HKCCE2091]|nr:hypothetical protein [Rhodobacterales bacterium HKCCE2091]